MPFDFYIFCFLLSDFVALYVENEMFDGEWNKIFTKYVKLSNEDHTRLVNEMKSEYGYP